MRSEDWERTAKIAEHKFKKFCGFWSRGGQMRRVSMFANDARLAFGQFVTRGKCDTFDRSEKIFCCSFSDMAHAMVPEIYCLNYLGEKDQADRAFVRGIDKFEIHKVQVV